MSYRTYRTIHENYGVWMLCMFPTSNVVFSLFIGAIGRYIRKIVDKRTSHNFKHDSNDSMLNALISGIISFKHTHIYIDFEECLTSFQRRRSDSASTHPNYNRTNRLGNCGHIQVGPVNQWYCSNRYTITVELLDNSIYMLYLGCCH